MHCAYPENHLHSPAVGKISSGRYRSRFCNGRQPGSVHSSPSRKMRSRKRHSLSHPVSLGQALLSYESPRRSALTDSLTLNIVTVITLMIVALVVIIVVMRPRADVVQHDAENFRPYIRQELASTAHDVTPTLAAMNYQQHAVHARRDEDAVRE